MPDRGHLIIFHCRASSLGSDLQAKLIRREKQPPFSLPFPFPLVGLPAVPTECLPSLLLFLLPTPAARWPSSLLKALPFRFVSSRFSPFPFFFLTGLIVRPFLGADLFHLLLRADQHISRFNLCFLVQSSTLVWCLLPLSVSASSHSLLELDHYFPIYWPDRIYSSA